MFSNVAEAIAPLWKRARAALVGVIIVGYLSSLGFGLFCHTFRWNAGVSPLMYFVVWDMFCGWTGYEIRYHVIAEGDSGTYYQAVPGPWGEYVPFGGVARRHYDANGIFGTAIAMNVLRHTAHEPIRRLFIVEENWAKKYNMPDDMWARRWDQSKKPYHYFTIRHVVTADGQLLETYPCFFAQSLQRSVYANPRLVQEMNHSQPFYVVGDGDTHMGLDHLLRTTRRTTGPLPLGP